MLTYQRIYIYICIHIHTHTIDIYISSGNQTWLAGKSSITGIYWERPLKNGGFSDTPRLMTPEVISMSIPSLFHYIPLIPDF